MKKQSTIKYENNMNKERYNQIIDEVYRKYADSHEYFVDGWVHVIPMLHNKETFINECKTSPEFSKNWGLKIEERELSWDERADLSREKRRTYANWSYWSLEEMEYHLTDVWNIPTRLITLTNNNETIESYE